MSYFSNFEICKAKQAIVDLEEAIIIVLQNNPEGLRNSEIAKGLGIESSFNGKQRNYITYSIIGALLSKGLVVRKSLDQPIYILK